MSDGSVLHFFQNQVIQYIHFRQMLQTFSNQILTTTTILLGVVTHHSYLISFFRISSLPQRDVQSFVRSVYYLCKDISYQVPGFFKSCFLTCFPNVEQYFSDMPFKCHKHLLTLLPQLTLYASIRIIRGWGGKFLRDLRLEMQ